MLKFNIYPLLSTPYWTFFSNIDLYVIVKLDKKFVMSKLRLNYIYIRAIKPLEMYFFEFDFFCNGDQLTEIWFESSFWQKIGIYD